MTRRTAASAPHPIAFTIGSRRLLTVDREMVTLAFSLHDVLTGRLPAVPSLARVEGLRVLSAPAAAEARLRQVMPGFLVGGRDVFARSYIDMGGSYERYLAQFSGKTRSTLRRKRRKLEQADGGTLDLRAYRTPDEIAEFAALAEPLSQRTYQARLLDAGLPQGADALAEMQGLAAQDRLRAFLLFLGGQPIAYLYLPVDGDTLIYAHLGYDPAHAGLSPGTVLQMAALEALFAEQRFRYFDFTEGDGPHKALFRTASERCASLLLLRPSLANRMLLGSLDIFDRSVAGAKALAAKSGAEGLLRRALRG